MHYDEHNRQEFDKHFGDTTQLMKRGMTIAFFMWFVWFLFVLTAAGGLVYVAIHFLAKVW